MADPIRTDLKLVDENYTAPAGADATAKATAVKAAAIREGIRRQKQRDASERKAEAAAHQANVEGVKSAHVDELNRFARNVDKASYWRGFAIGGMVIGAVVGTALAIYAAAIINPAFDAAARMQMQQSVVDTMQRASEP